MKSSLDVDDQKVAALLGQPAKRLALRLCNTPQKGRIVRLAAAKCTIGAANDCTLRLRADGVAPLHCLILRGPNGTVIRRWAEDTRLNDRNFSDAPLAIGDRLGIGPVELEVVEDEAVDSGVSDEHSESGEQDGALLAEMEAQLVQRERTLAEQEQNLIQKHESLKHDRAELEAQRRVHQENVDRLASEAKPKLRKAATAAPVNSSADKNSLATERAEFDDEKVRFHEQWLAQRQLLCDDRQLNETAERKSSAIAPSCSGSARN